MARFKSQEWKRGWGLSAAWSPRELASIICGFDPKTVRPDAEGYADVEDAIMRSLQVKDPALPVIEDLRWPLDLAERMYVGRALLKPRQAHAWGKQRYPKTIIPFSADDFGAEPDNVFDRLPERARKVIQIVLKAPAGTSQKEIANEIQSSLKTGPRNAQAIAALFRPDESVSQDQRAARRR